MEYILIFLVNNGQSLHVNRLTEYFLKMTRKKYLFGKNVEKSISLPAFILAGNKLIFNLFRLCSCHLVVRMLFELSLLLSLFNFSLQ